MRFTHEGENLTLRKARYAGGGHTGFVVDDESGFAYAHLTVNPLSYGVTLLDGEHLVKAYAENADVAASLLASGLFVDTGKRVATGYVNLEIWRYVNV